MAKKKLTREQIRKLIAPCQTIDDIRAIPGLESAARREGKEFWNDVFMSKRRIKPKGFYNNPDNLRSELNKGDFSSRTDLEKRNPTLYNHVREQFPQWLTERWPQRSDKGTHKPVAQKDSLLPKLETRLRRLLQKTGNQSEETETDIQDCLRKARAWWDEKLHGPIEEARISGKYSWLHPKLAEPGTWIKKAEAIFKVKDGFIAITEPSGGFLHPDYISSISAMSPKLLALWDCEKNGDMSPDRVPVGSNGEYWFCCPDNPKHPSYLAVPNEMFGLLNRKGKKDLNYIRNKCPQCAIVTPGENDLLTVYKKDACAHFISMGLPELVAKAEADKFGEQLAHEYSDQNKLPITAIRLNSSVPVYWNRFGDSEPKKLTPWQRAYNKGTYLPSMPASLYKVSIPEFLIQSQLKAVFPSLETQYRDPNMSKNKIGAFDVWIPEINTLLEVDGPLHTNPDQINRDIGKNDYAQTHKQILIRVRDLQIAQCAPARKADTPNTVYCSLKIDSLMTLDSMHTLIRQIFKRVSKPTEAQVKRFNEYLASNTLHALEDFREFLSHRTVPLEASLKVRLPEVAEYYSEENDLPATRVSYGAGGIFLWNCQNKTCEGTGTFPRTITNMKRSVHESPNSTMWCDRCRKAHYFYENRLQTTADLANVLIARGQIHPGDKRSLST